MPTSIELQQQLLSTWMEALATPAFKRHGITLHHLNLAMSLATQRSLQRLIQALFREELISVVGCRFDQSSRCYLALGDRQLCFEYLKPGRMGSWDLRGNVWLLSPGQPDLALLFPSQLLALLNPYLSHSAPSDVVQRLAREIDNSFCNDTLCLAFHQGWTQQLNVQVAQSLHPTLLGCLKTGIAPQSPTLLLEQWGTLGHPWHPNYKTKLGLEASQLIALSPEFDAGFAVVLCALHREFVHVESLPGTQDYRDWWQGHFPHATQQLRDEITRRGLDAHDYQPLPAHPWQVRETFPTTFAREIAGNLLLVTDIVAFTARPTMSFRTVVPDTPCIAPMVKLPVAMRLTSVQRTVSPRSARMGPRISHLLMEILANEPQIRSLLGIVPERIGVHYAPHPADDERSRHAAVLYRDNPLSLLQPGEMAVPVGSLFAMDEQQRPLLCQWVRLAKGRGDCEAMLAFFDDYLSIAIPGLLGIYLLYGVAFEAHQQNSFMVMSADGQLNRLLLRDFGDIRIDRQALHGQGLDIELHDPKMTLYDQSAFVRDKLLHSTFMCHLGELALLCARHWNVPQGVLWDQLSAHVSQCFEALRERVEPQRWQTERQALLEHDWPAKSFMRMRLLDSHSDIVGRLINPLRKPANAD